MSSGQIGVWETKNSPSAVAIGRKNSKTITFSAADPEPPFVPVGFRMLYIDNNKDKDHRIGSRTYSSDIYEDKFTLNIDSLPHTKMYNGAAMWFKYPNSDPDLQYDSVDIDNSQHAETNVTKRIVFDTPYDTQPKVFVGISSIDISTAWRIHAYATDIDVNGFTLHVDPAHTTKLHKAQLNWIAFSANRTDITTGTFSSTDNGVFNGQVNIKPALSETPQLFYALSMFDSDITQDLQIRLDVTSISASGFNWKITTAGASKNRRVSAAYLAIVL